MSVLTKSDSVLFTFDIRPLKMTDKMFYEFCQRNQEFRFEIDKRGNLIVMPPTFLETSRKNNKINFQLTAWAEKDNTGEVFESDGMFTLRTVRNVRRMPFGF